MNYCINIVEICSNNGVTGVHAILQGSPICQTFRIINVRQDNPKHINVILHENRWLRRVIINMTSFSLVMIVLLPKELHLKNGLGY